MKPLEPTPYERVLIARAIGDRQLRAEAEYAYYHSRDGLNRLTREGRHIEMLFLNSVSGRSATDRCSSSL